MAKSDEGLAARVKTRCAEPEKHGGGQCECGVVDGWAAVVSGCYAAPVLQVAEHDLDAVTPFVRPLVVFVGQGMGFAARNAGLDALLLQGSSEPVSVIAAIGEHPL